jgi:hypothetical protein
MNDTVKWTALAAVLALGVVHPILAVAGIMVWAFARELGK